MWEHPHDIGISFLYSVIRFSTQVSFFCLRIWSTHQIRPQIFLPYIISDHDVIHSIYWWPRRIIPPYIGEPDVIQLYGVFFVGVTRIWRCSSSVLPIIWSVLRRGQLLHGGETVAVWFGACIRCADRGRRAVRRNGALNRGRRCLCNVGVPTDIRRPVVSNHNGCPLNENYGILKKIKIIY